MSLVVVGTMAYDAIETPFGKTDKILGGAATFIALASAYLYDEVKAISVVGNDFDPNYIKMLEDRGISLEGVQIIPDQKSFFWSGRYHHDLNSRDTIITELNVLADFDPKVPDSYQDCEYLMLGNLTPAVQKSVIERLNKRPACIAMDTMNFWIESSLDTLKETLKMIDVLIINDEEARQLSQEYSLKKASQVIMGMGPEFLVIKKGEHGALLFHKNEVFSAPGLPLDEVFDPTGAGDTFAGGFMGYLARNGEISFQNMKRAVIYGSSLASFCVEKFGTERLQNLSKEEIDSRVRQFVKLADFNMLSKDISDAIDQSA